MSKYEERLKELSVSAASPPSSVTIEKLSEDFAFFKKTVLSFVDTLYKNMQNFETRLDEHESYMRRKHLLLHGVSEDQTEENISKYVTDFLTSNLKLKNITSQSFHSIYRIGKAAEKAGKPRPILIKMYSMRDRMDIWRNKRLLKGSRIVVTESLTSNRQQLLTIARKSFNNNCWTSEGRIFVRLPDGTRRVIISKAQLDDTIAILGRSTNSASSEGANRQLRSHNTKKN